MEAFRAEISVLQDEEVATVSITRPSIEILAYAVHQVMEVQRPCIVTVRPIGDSWGIGSMDRFFEEMRYQAIVSAPYASLSRELRQVILDKIYYGESEWVSLSQQGRRMLAVHAVEVDGHMAFVLYDETHHDLFSAVPVAAGYIRRYVAHKNYLDREAKRRAAGVANVWNTARGKAKKRVAKKSGIRYI